VGRVSGALPLAVLAGCLAGGGLALLVAALYGLPPAASRPPGVAGMAALSGRRAESLLRRAAVAVVVGVVLLVLTRWPVLAAGGVVVVLFWRSVFGGLFGGGGEVPRLEALATWTESLRDTIAGAVGLEQALPATAATASPLIAGELALLVERLRIRMPLPEALTRFADDLDDPSADLIVAALVLNARLRGPGLRDLLGALSASVREELDMRRRVEAQRRSTRRSVQLIMLVTLAVAGGLAVFNGQYVAPYDSAVGQVVLAGVLAIFLAGFVWLRRLATFEVPDRFVGSGARAGSL